VCVTMAPEEAGEYAYRAILDAIRIGFPVYVKRLVRGAFLLRREGGGKGVVFSGWVPGEEPGQRYVTLGAEPVTVWKYRVAKVAGGDVVETYPFNVAKTAGHYVDLFSTFEADVWYRRLLAFWRGEYSSAENPPTIVKRLAEKMGCRTVLFFPGLEDYVVLCNNVAVAWFNVFTGKVDDVRGYVRAAGLLGRPY